jgi:signal peptidase I
MIDIKADFSGGLNLDDALYNVPKNAYIDAMNVTTDAIEGSNDRAITNIVGNQLVNYTLPAGRNVCIGAHPNDVTNTVIYFVWNINDYHLVLEYENTSRTISPIFRNLTDSDGVDVLGFLENKKITSVNIYNRDENAEDGGGDLLFFLDSLGRPTTMDIERFKNEEYTPVTRDILDVCKRPPLFPPDVLYANDTNRDTNNLRNRLFRFKYRYVYDANERSVCSPISTLPLPLNILDEEFNADPTNNNKIEIQLTTGDKDVKSIELLMSYVLKTNDWSDFALVENINKESLLLSSSYIIQPNPTPLYSDAIISFSGIITENTLIEVIFKDISINQDVVIASYTTVAGDTETDIVDGLVASSILPATNTSGNLVITYFVFDYAYNSVAITGATTDLGTFIYSFYNNGTYPVIDVAESTQLFDYVPDLANAQEMANGNVLIYGGITEGYDKDILPNVVNTILTTLGGSLPGGLSYKIIENKQTPFQPGLGTNWTTTIEFSGIPIPNTQIKIFGEKYSDGTIVQYATYTTIDGDDANKVAFEIAKNFNSTYPNGFLSGAQVNQNKIIIDWGFTNDAGIAFFNSITITAPTFTSADNSIPTFLFSTTRRLGIAYFDKKGKTNGILYSAELNFPKYNEDEDELVLVPYINTKVYHAPPFWAHSYGFYLTKEATQFLYWQSIKVESDSEFLYFNITNLGENQKLYPTTTNVLSYTFQDGDRLRLIKKVNADPPVIYPQLGNYDAAVIGQVKDPVVTPAIPNGTYIKIKKIAPFDSVEYEDDKFIIQLYRPTQQLPTGINEVYYEFGQQYGIGNPGTRLRYHLGMITDQGRIPTDVINCSVSIVTNPSITIDIATLTFSGLPLVDTQIDITITQLPSTTITLASYIIQLNDTLQDVIDNLFNQLLLQSGTYLIDVIKSTTLPNTFSISYWNILYSFAQSDVVFAYPNAGTIPAEFNFYGGDVYVRPRTISVSNGIDTSGVATYNTLDRNFLDDYISAVNNIEGRPSVIDVNARRAYYSTMVRFGQSYQPNTNINGLNRFFPNNFDEYDYSYGDIMRLKVRDRFIRVFQKFKVGKVPLYSQIVKDPANAQNLIVSDKLINPIAYYVGDLGIGEHAESLISYSYADYFTSNIKGIIARVGEEGVTFLSIDHKVDSWATSNLPLRTGDYKVYGGLDQRIGNYIIALEATPTDPAVTLVFDLDYKCFSTFLSYYPEMMTTLGTLFISFKDGQLYTHDNPAYNTFFGQPAADSSITLAFNQNPLDKKTFMSVGEVASQIWDVPVIKTDINSYGTTKMESNLVDDDFVELEGTYEAPVLRDVNSIGGILEGDSMKGKYMTMKFRAKTPTSLVSLNLLSLKSINSPLNNR